MIHHLLIFASIEHRGRKRNMKSWRANWSDTEGPEHEPRPHSEDDDAERSPKRRRMSPTGLTCEIQGFEIKQSKSMPTSFVKKTVAKGDDVAVPTSPVAKETRISGVFNINDSLNESLMDGSFIEQDIIHQPVRDREGQSEGICAPPGTSTHEPLGHNGGISVPPGSCYDSCGEIDITGDNHGKSMNTSPSVFYSCSSEVSAIPKSTNSNISTRGPHASSTRDTHASPENSHMTISSASFVTPARSSREFHSSSHDVHAGQSTSEENGKKVFQTPVGNAPKHFQTASVTRIRFQSPMEIAYNVPPRSSNTTPRRRRHNHVSMASYFHRH